MNKIKRKKWHIITQIYFKKKFRKIGKNTVINKPLQIDSANSISLGEDVYVAEGAWLMGNRERESTAYIMDGTVIGHFAHIVALHSVTVESNVLIADKVYISDCTHIYDDKSLPILKQGVRNLSPVKIGEGSWIGENVCIFGASIGKHCVIGANSVINSDIPDYCMAVGSPGRIVKKYDLDAKKWVKV